MVSEVVNLFVAGERDRKEVLRFAVYLFSEKSITHRGGYDGKGKSQVVQ